MLGELQSIYDVKTGLSEKLNKLKRGLTVEDPDEVGPAQISDDQEQMPEAVMNVVQTPSSLANDSQLHQLLSNMHNQLKDMADNDSDDELTLAKEIADIDKAQQHMNRSSDRNNKLNKSF